MLESTDSYLTKTLLFGCTSFDTETNTLLLNATIFSPLKDLKNLFFRKKQLAFHMQFFNPFGISVGLLYLSVFSF